MNDNNLVATTPRTPLPGEILEKVLISGDLAKLTPEERLAYYSRVCESLGLNPLTQPFAYITLSGKLTLYARKDCTEQLRRRDRISLTIVSREVINEVYIVTARATTPDGRTDESTGAVNLSGLKGDAIANAMMKSETKGKRRVTLSIVGLGFLDESEIDSIHDAQPHAEQPAIPAQPKDKKDDSENEWMLQQWLDWLAKEPDLLTLNMGLKDLADTPKPAKTQAWQAIQAYAKSKGYVFNTESKMFQTKDAA